MCIDKIKNKIKRHLCLAREFRVFRVCFFCCCWLLLLFFWGGFAFIGNSVYNFFLLCFVGCRLYSRILSGLSVDRCQGKSTLQVEMKTIVRVFTMGLVS